MEKQKKNRLATLNEALKRIQKRPPDKEKIEKFNEWMRKDEELEKQKGSKPEKKIAREIEAPV